MSTGLSVQQLSLEVILQTVLEVSLHIQQRTNVEEILQGTIAHSRTILGCDRVLIYRLLADDDAVVAYESTSPAVTPILGQLIYDPCLKDTWIDRYHQGEITTIADIYTAHLTTCHVELLQWFQVRANLVVPIVSGGNLWGLLIAHQCHQPRQWQTLEVQYLQQVGLHLGIAIQQADLWQAGQTALRVQESEERFRQLCQYIPVGIFLTDLNGQCTYVNDRWCQLTGLTPEQAMGNGWIEALYPDDRPHLVKEWQAFVGDQCDFNLEYRFMRPDGKICWVAAQAMPFHDDRHTVSGFIGTIIDISDRKRREDLIRNIAQGISATTGDAFFRSLVGYLICVLEMEHAIIGEFISPQYDRVRVIAGISNGKILDGEEYSIVGTPCQEILKQRCSVYPHTMQQLVPDGQMLQDTIAEGYVGTLLLNATGDVIGYICVFNNQPITDIKFVEEVLTIFAVRAASELERQQSERLLRRYERIVSSTADCISLIDRTYTYQVVNQSYLDWHQKTYEQIVGHSVPDLIGLELFQQLTKPCIDRCLAGEQNQTFEVWQTYADGQQRFIQGSLTPYVETNGSISGVVVNIHDLTTLKQAEAALIEQQQFIEQIAESASAILYVYDLIEQRNVYVNQRCQAIIGYLPDEIFRMGENLFQDLIHPDDLPAVRLNAQYLCQQTFRDNQDFVQVEYRIRHKSGAYRWFLSRDKILNYTPDGSPKQIVGAAVDITELKETQATLALQVERERLLMAIAHNIRQTLNLDLILHTTVTEVRQLLQVDRVIIYRIQADWSGIVIAESIAADGQSILGTQITNDCLVEKLKQLYTQGGITVIDDVNESLLNPCYWALLQKMQVRATVVVPILQNDHLWGLLGVQQCRSPRHWETWEIELQQELVTQIAIAIQQSELYQQVQSLNTDLELQVQERTAQLQQALNFEALLKGITDQVRDNLDEEAILQKAVVELANALNTDCCDTVLYDLERTSLRVKHECCREGFGARNLAIAMSESSDPNLYVQLLQGQYCHFCLLGENVIRAEQPPKTILACPIQDDQGVLGDLWLFKSAQEIFDEQEIRLVQQVANQCAIALRQSRLYQASQSQVKELERLNQLKDDFLSTVSHELRSPMSNMKMAIQMLEICLNQSGLLADGTTSISRYFKILREEGEREINLINDLLDLARLDAGTESLSFNPVDLQFYIPHLAESFIERMHQQQQQFHLQIETNLPPLFTDLPSLERVLGELLHNACKYTPAEESISVTAQKSSNSLLICVQNSGVEISATECDRIFDKFYRVPNNDPWKHGGTGLGLALVKKLTERLGGEIWVESNNRLTTFFLEFKQV